MLEEYRRSIKMAAAEEMLDLVIYRPMAFIIVKAFYRFPITPNQITFLSLLVGLCAAGLFSLGTVSAFFYGAICYIGANVLDCADGQLARLQNSGTLFGRVVDGFADYISTIAVLLGIGIGLHTQDENIWYLVIAAGISSALHAMFFDHYQNEFISTVRGERNSLAREMEQFLEEIQRMKQVGVSKFKGILLSLYVRYLSLQNKSSTNKQREAFDPVTYKNENSMMIRLWSFLGPTTNRTLLILCALFNWIEVYLWSVVIIGNVWLFASYFLQRRIHRKMVADMVPPIVEEVR